MLFFMTTEQRFTFSKDERVTGTNRVDRLFESGDSFMAYPLRVVYGKREKINSTQLSILVSVPKKRLRAAVDRNRMKRLIREAYRLNRPLIFTQGRIIDAHYDIAFVYVKNEKDSYKNIEKAVRKALQIIADKEKENAECGIS